MEKDNQNEIVLNEKSIEILITKLVPMLQYFERSGNARWDKRALQQRSFDTKRYNPSTFAQCTAYGHKRWVKRR